MAGDSRRLTLQIDSDNLRRDRESGPAEMFWWSFAIWLQVRAYRRAYRRAMRLHLIRSKMVGYLPAPLARKKDSTLLEWLP